MAFISGFKTERPDFQTQQSSLNQMLHQDLEARQDIPKFKNLVRIMDRYVCKPEHIFERGHELQDYNSPLIRSQDKESLIQEKTQFFSTKAYEKLNRIFESADQAPSILSHVTCTGYSSPSPTQKLISAKKWTKTANLHIYHMGCYASFPAIQTSIGELSRRKQSQLPFHRADVFHSELCSLHFDRDQLNPEQLVVQTLFADGYIGYSVTLDKPTVPGFEVLALQEEILPDSLDLMTWQNSNPGFTMTLSRDVPKKIKEHLHSFLDRLTERSNVPPDSAPKIFGIHPGGPKIISEIQDLLHLSEDQVQHSRKVLKHHGNMSSVTLPTVWKSILDDSTVIPGTIVISFAFGPGLTICGGIFRKL